MDWIDEILADAPTEDEQMLSAIETYFTTGEVHGDFLRNLMANDFARTVTCADAHNSEFIHEWAIWVWNSIPMESWGSAQKVEDYEGMSDL